MNTTSKRQDRLMAANDNNGVKARLELGSGISKLANRRIETQQSINSSLRNTSNSRNNYEKDAARPAELQALFLLVLGFTLTSIATLTYVLLSAKYTPLISTLIPSIILGGLSLTAMRSTAAFWGSLISVAIWSIAAIISLYNNDTIPLQGWVIALPAILGLLIVMASQFLSRAALLLALTCSYIWLGIFAISSELSVLTAGSLIFIFGTAHHRLGKVWEDKDVTFAHDHTLIGWIAAMTGLIWTQHYFIPLRSFEPNITGILAHQSSLWFLGTSLGIGFIVMSSIWRIQQNRLSWLGFIHIVAGCLLLPLIAFQPNLTAIFESVTTLPATPYLGFTLGATVAALAFGLIMNGLRRRYYIDAIIGAFAICVQIVLIYNQDYMTFDLFPIILFTVMFVLCFELIISRQSILTAPMAPKYNLKSYR